MKTDCDTCKHKDKNWDDLPCDGCCTAHSGYEADAISREDAIQAVNNTLAEYIPYFRSDQIGIPLECARALNDLPSVTQEPKTGHWIPVSEKLPEDGQEILFSTKTGRVHSGKYHDDNSANQWYSHHDKCNAWNNVVTAWMPLPKPYEPQESEG